MNIIKFEEKDLIKKQEVVEVQEPLITGVAKIEKLQTTITEYNDVGEAKDRVITETKEEIESDIAKLEKELASAKVKLSKFKRGK